VFGNFLVAPGRILQGLEARAHGTRLQFQYLEKVERALRLSVAGGNALGSSMNSGQAIAFHPLETIRVHSYYYLSTSFFSARFLCSHQRKTTPLE